jgi:hypothetical protein
VLNGDGECLRLLFFEAAEPSVFVFAVAALANIRLRTLHDPCTSGEFV